MSRRYCAAIMMLLGIVLPSSGFGTSVPDLEFAPAIVTDSIAVSRQMPFQAQVVSNNETIRVYRAPDQTTGQIQERRDYIQDDAPGLTILDLPAGFFFFKGDFVAEMKWDGYRDITPALTWKWAWSAIERDVKLVNQYQIELTADTPKPMWQITVTTPTDNETLCKIFQKPLAEMIANREKFLQSFPAIKQLRIDPDNLFMYSCIMSNAAGKKLLEVTWGEVEFPETIAPELFVLPRAPETTIQTKEDFGKNLPRLFPALPGRKMNR